MASFGTSENDTLIGSSGADTLDGLDGDDLLFGDAGDDSLTGGNGKDTLYGGPGNDALIGGTGDDFFYDPDGDNVLNGGDGNDLFFVSVSVGSANTVTGGAGQDTYFLDPESPSLAPGSSGQAYVITDFEAGGGGDQLFVLGLFALAPTYTGGDPFASGFLRFLQSGADTLLQGDRDGAAGSAFDWTTIVTLKNVTASSITHNNLPGLIFGTDEPEILEGTSDDDVIFGGGGDDTLVGGDGDDVLDGGTGTDRMEGGNGNDTYFVDDVKDEVVETSNSPPLVASELAAILALAGIEGITDTVIAAVNYSLANVELEFVENLTLNEASTATLATGNALDNVLTGNALNNTLSGLDGNDTLDGGVGADTAVYSGNHAANTITKTASGYTVSGPEGNDTLSNIERLKFSDQSLAVDMAVSEAGGKTALLLGACLGANGLSNQATVGAILGYFDGGYTLTDAATALVDAGIVAQLAGGADNKHFVDWMALNLVDALPDASTEAVLIDFITSGQFTQATFLATLAAHQINQDHIGLTGLQDNGMEYV